MRTRCNRAIVAATAAAIALTSVSFTPAFAAPVSKDRAVAAAGNTDFSSRRRGHYRGADRAVLGAVAGVFGAVASIAAAQAARERYRHDYGYGSYYGPYPPPYGYYRPYYHYR